MVEPIMYLAIGFLISMLLGLMIVPLVHNRAVRLTTKRMEAATPLSMAEIQADKDQLAIEIGDALAQVFDAAARLAELACRLLGFATLLLEPRLGRRKFLFGISDPVLELIDLGAHRDQFDLAALRRHRTVGQFGIEFGELVLLVV